MAVVRAMYPNIERELSQGTYLGHMTRHTSGLFQGFLARGSGGVIQVKMPIKRVQTLMCWNTRSSWWRISVGLSPKRVKFTTPCAPSRGVLR
ncbi:hypothetical protein ACLK17_25615 [Escherichia coli]